MSKRTLSHSVTALNRIFQTLGRLARPISVLILFIVPALAQSGNDLGVPAQSKPGQATTSTYARDKIETVNLANQNLSLRFPLVTIGGRGSASYEIALAYNSKVWSSRNDQEPGNPTPIDPYPPFDHWSGTYDDTYMGQPGLNSGGSGWKLTLGPSLKMQKVEIEPIPQDDCHQPDCGYRYVLTRLWLVLADGSEIELRDNLTDGAPAATPVNSFGLHTSIDRDRGRVWHSTDGSNIIYIADSSTELMNHHLDGWVFYPDGTRLRMNSTSGWCSQIMDRNGNFITFDSTGFTDELGRQVIVTSTETTITVTAKGYNGVPDRVFTADVGMIGALDGSGVPTNLRSDFRSLQRPFYSGDYLRTRGQSDQQHTDPLPHTDLFNGSENPDAIDQHMAMTGLHLPDGRSFRFRYNQYGEVAEIVYPGGGVSQIDYGDGFGGSSPAFLMSALNRGVVQRRSLTNGVDVDAVTLYSKGSATVGGVTYPTVTMETRQGSATGTSLASETHYFLAVDSNYYSGYERWQNAKEFQVDRQTGSGTITTKYTWAQRASVVWANDAGSSQNLYASLRGQEQPPNDPRLTVEDTILENGKMKRVEYGYDVFNNVTSVKEYDFGTAGSPGILLRQTLRTYGANIGGNYGIAINGYCYSNLNPADSSCGGDLASDVTSIIYQRHLLLNETIKDGLNNQRAYSESEYDNYSGATNHAPVVLNGEMLKYDGSRFSSFNSSTQPRGNVTKASGWAGGSNYIYTFRQYDNAGNVLWSKDPNGKISTVSYTDNFGDGSNPDSGAAGTNGKTYALGTSATNALGQQVKIQFDYTRGVATGVKDPNTVISRTEYDSLGRPVRTTAAVNLAEQTITETSYPTANANYTTLSKQLDSTRWLASKSTLDGFERVVTSWQAEDGQHAAYATFTIRADTTYDALGRVTQVNNPYRSGESPVYSTTVYDVAGRVTSITTPDSAIVSTAYSGDRVLVKDQDGKERISRADALGQLKEVWEITTNDQAKYPGTEAVTFPGHSEVTYGFKTVYDYDTLGDLTKVTQGNQPSRDFAYDPLRRLTSAANPESGYVAYQYDNVGNLQVKTDARAVSTHFSYDDLNRLKRRWYNGSSDPTYPSNNVPALPTNVGATDEVNYFYDAQSLLSLAPAAPGFSRGASIGRMVAATYGPVSSAPSSAGDYLSYDSLGRVVLKIQQTGGVNYQASAAYNKASELTSLAYPSSRAVNSEYDAAGRTTSVIGNLGDGTSPSRNYATGIIYDAAGRLKKEKFGTDTPIYNKLFYNVRGQLAEIRESTSYTGTTDTTWDRGAIINHYSAQCWGMCGGSSSTTPMTDNNDNLKKQDNYIPGATQVTFTDVFNYDALNRLQDVTESKSVNGGTLTQSFAQAYAYDRFGNRTINQSGTTQGVGINSTQAAVVTNTITNRLYAPGETETNHPLIDYDTAGNQKKDYYSGNGVAYDRLYDAENRMVSSTASDTLGSQTSTYTYDGNGARVRRNVNGTKTWQVYGMGGELLAEYGENGAGTAPQKEYGYRNGQLLVTATSPASGRTNVALAANGAVATASSQQDAGRGPAAAINGDRKGIHWGTDAATGSGWNNGTTSLPAWLQVDFNGSKTIDEVDLFAPQDDYTNPIEPTSTMTFSLYGLSGFDIQYWNGSAWTTISGCSVTGNNKVWRQLTFTAITTTKIRVLTNASPDSYSRMTELEAWTPATTPTRSNMALAANGAVATASSQQDAGRGPAAAINGDRKGIHWGTDAATGSGWNNGTTTLPAWLQVDFNGSKTIDEIDVVGPQDDYTNPIEPTTSLTFSLYSLSGFDVQYWTGSAWATIPGCSVTGNNKVWRQFTFTAITTTKIRVLTNASPDSYSRLTELEAWGMAAGGGSTTADIQWLVTDQLGTPRMVFDKSGSLTSMKRHDYLPFGEELFAAPNQRTTTQGYSATDGLRQKFTQKERDIETGLDYFGARYYASISGRFTSPDPYNIVADVQFEGDQERAKSQLDQYLSQPQQWNRYSYAINNPLKYIDPTGEKVQLTGETEAERAAALQRVKDMLGEERFKLVKVSADGRTLSLSNEDVVKMQQIGGNDLERDFSTGMAEVLNSSDTLEFRVVESFTNVNGYKIDLNTYDYPGALTVSGKDSSNGNVQIFVHPQAGAIATKVAKDRGGLRDRTSDGRDLVITTDGVVAHEFGHGADRMAAQGPRSVGGRSAPGPRWQTFENAIRSRDPNNSQRRIAH